MTIAYGILILTGALYLDRKYTKKVEIEVKRVYTDVVVVKEIA
jgi:hypothetical protein